MSCGRADHRMIMVSRCARRAEGLLPICNNNCRLGWVESGRSGRLVHVCLFVSFQSHIRFPLLTFCAPPLHRPTTCATYTPVCLDVRIVVYKRCRQRMRSARLSDHAADQMFVPQSVCLSVRSSVGLSFYLHGSLLVVGSMLVYFLFGR